MTTMCRACPGCSIAVRPGAVYCPGCGARLSAGQAPDPIARAGLWRRMRGRHGRPVRVLTVVLAVAAVVGVTVVYLRQATGYVPDQPVRDWFAALAARDTATAARIRPGLDILSGDFLKSDAYSPPADIQILATTYAPSTDEQKRPNHAIAYVGVHYRIAARWFDQHIQVNRSRTGTARPWTLGDGAAGSLAVTAGPLHTVVVGHTRITTQPSPDQALAGDTLQLPPGQYTIRPDPGDPIFTAKPIDVVVAGRQRGQPATLAALAPWVQQQALDAVTTLVRARIDDCAARRTLSMVDCPFDRTGGSYTGTVTAVRWTIRRYPAITLATVEHPYPGGPIAVLGTSAPGVARVVYTAVSTDGKPTAEQQQFSVDGDIRLEHGGLVWTGGKSGRLI